MTPKKETPNPPQKTSENIFRQHLKLEVPMNPGEITQEAVKKMATGLAVAIEQTFGVFLTEAKKQNTENAGIVALRQTASEIYSYGTQLIQKFGPQFGLTPPPDPPKK